MAIVLVVPKKDGVWLAWSDDSNFRASEALPLGSEKGRDGLLEGIVPLWGNRSGETRSDQIRACSPFPAENFGNMTGRAVLAFMVDGSGSGKWMKGHLMNAFDKAQRGVVAHSMENNRLSRRNCDAGDFCSVTGPEVDGKIICNRGPRATQPSGCVVCGPRLQT